MGSYKGSTGYRPGSEDIGQTGDSAGTTLVHTNICQNSIYSHESHPEIINFNFNFFIFKF